MTEEIESLSNARHAESYKDLFGGIPEALYVLGGGVEKDGGAMGFRSPHFFSNNGDGVGGGRYRMLATRDVAKTFKKIPIYTSGGTSLPNVPATADVVAHELVLFGVNEDRITHFTDTKTTAMEMVRVIQLAGSLTSDESRLVVITNKYHIPRTERLFWMLVQGNTHVLPQNHYEDFQQFEKDFQQDLNNFARKNAQVIFSHCERIRGVKDPSFADFFEEVKATTKYIMREEKEAQGLVDLNGKTYKSRV